MFVFSIVVICSLPLFCCAVYQAECDAGAVSHKWPQAALFVSLSKLSSRVWPARVSCYCLGLMLTLIDASLHDNKNEKPQLQNYVLRPVCRERLVDRSINRKKVGYHFVN